MCVGDMSTTHSYLRDGNGLSIIQSSTPSSVVGFWSFDDAAAQDSSSLVNPLSGVPPAAPGILRGSSGYFDGRTAYYVPRHDAYKTRTATISAWVYIISDVRDSFRVIFDKANGAAYSLRVWPDTRTLRVVAGGKTADSRSSLPLRRWTHVALALSASGAQLYVNGVPDVAVSIHDTPWAPVESSLYIASLESGRLLGVEAYIDDIQITNDTVSAETIKAVGALAFWGLPGGADSAWFGCEGCTHKQAVALCANPPPTSSRPKSHICTEREQASSVLLVARSMGWVNNLTPVIFDLENSAKYAANVPGVAICCPNE